MTDDMPHDDLERRTWEVFERALDAAIAADPSDTAALELGVRVAEMLVNARVVAPPRARRSGNVEGRELHEMLEPPSRLELRVGNDLAGAGASEVVASLEKGRRALAREYGLVITQAQVRPDSEFADDEFEVRINGDSVFRGQATRSESQATTVAMRTMEIAAEHLAELLDREEVAELLNLARRDSPMVVQELVPNMLGLGQLRQVLQSLVREQVPIRDLSTILNALADHAVYTKDPPALSEHVRAALGRKICARYQSPDGTLKAFALTPDAERAIQNAIQLNETGQVLMLDPNTSQAIANNVAAAIERHREAIGPGLIVAPPKLRRHLKALLDRSFPNIVVLSSSEIVGGVTIELLETIDLDNSGARDTDLDPTLAATFHSSEPAASSTWLVEG